MDPETTGQRIARARRRRGLSQAVLAGLVGRSESWLSQVERGKRSIDSHAVLTRLAGVLRVEIEEVTGPAGGSGGDPRMYEPAKLIEQAMMGYGVAGAADADAGHTEAMARTAYRDYQATRYDSAARLVPGLIRAAEAVTLAGPDRWRLRALVYDVAAALLNRVSEPFLAWAAADRAMSAAQQSGEPLLAAAAAWRMAYVITSRDHPREGLDLAMAAAEALERSMRSPAPPQLSVYGALHLAAATAAAALYDQALTTTLLGKAHQIAGHTGDTNHMGTAFGPVNVAIHTVAASVQLGDAGTAAKTGEALDTEALPAGLTGRRTQVNLDLARAYAMRRQDAAAVNMLLAAEQLSPQLVRYDQRTHEVLTALLRREHKPSTPELRPLARRAGVI